MGSLDNISLFFDGFEEKDKKEIEEEILLYLDSFSRALIELEKILPKELYDKLEAKKLHAQTLDRQIKETKLVNLCPTITPLEMVDLINKTISFEFNPKHIINNLILERFEEIRKETVDI